MIPIPQRAAIAAFLALAYFLSSVEALLVLLTLWRMNQYGQWSPTLIGRAASGLMLKATGLQFGRIGEKKPND